MTPDQWAQLLVQAGAVGALIYIVMMSSNGTIRWGSQVDRQIAQYETQIARQQKDFGEAVARMEARIAMIRQDCETEVTRLEHRNDELWKNLKEAILTAREAAGATRKAADLAAARIGDRGPQDPS